MRRPNGLGYGRTTWRGSDSHCFRCIATRSSLRGHSYGMIHRQKEDDGMHGQLRNPRQPNMTTLTSKQRQTTRPRTDMWPTKRQDDYRWRSRPMGTGDQPQLDRVRSTWLTLLGQRGHPESPWGPCRMHGSSPPQTFTPEHINPREGLHRPSVMAIQDHPDRFALEHV